MLKSLRLKNWKSFGEEHNVIQFAPLTLLVGPNASGKSNALDALRFLQGAAFEYPFVEILTGWREGRRQIWPGIRGSVAEAARVSGTQFGIQSTWDLDWIELSHQLDMQTSNGVSANVEKLSRLVAPAPEPLFSVRSLGEKGAEFFFAPDEEGEEEGLVEGDSNATDRSQLAHVAALSDKPKDVTTACRGLRDALRSVVFLEILSHQMRDYRPAQEDELSTSGENISPVLASLDEAQRHDISDWVEELWGDNVSLSFDHTQLKEVMLYVTDRAGHKVSARSLSDGTLRFLGLVTALLTAQAGSIIVLEEPDMGIHPARIHLLAQLLESVTTNRGIQVIATTHSPTLLAHLSQEALGNVVAMSRSNEDGSTACSRLADLPHFETLKSSEHLEHLVSTGWIERAL